MRPTVFAGFHKNPTPFPKRLLYSLFYYDTPGLSRLSNQRRLQNEKVFHRLFYNKIAVSKDAGPRRAAKGALMAAKGSCPYTYYESRIRFLHKLDAAYS